MYIVKYLLLGSLIRSLGSFLRLFAGHAIDTFILFSVLSMLGFVFAHPASASFDAMSILHSQEQRFYGYAHGVGDYDRYEAAALVRMQ